MAAQTIFPLAIWQENTNQNSTPANDNALRVEALLSPAISFAAEDPSAPDDSPLKPPVDHDQYVVSVAWGGHTVGNIVIYLGGTWKEFAAYSGLAKVINGVAYQRIGSAWVQGPLATVATPSTATSPGVKGQIAYDATHFYVCVATNVWVRALLITF